MSTDPIALLRARVRHEPYPKLLGIEVLDIRPGYARVAMDYRRDMDNIFGMLHGGAVFSLMDEGFQLACNSHGQIAVAQQLSIYFLAAARPGARLIAEVAERNLTRRTALYDIDVREQDNGRRVAAAQALAFRKGGELPFDPEGKLADAAATTG